MDTKQCSKCRRWLPNSAYILALRCGVKRLYPSCRECESKQTLASPDIVRIAYGRPAAPRSGWGDGT